LGAEVGQGDRAAEHAEKVAGGFGLAGGGLVQGLEPGCEGGEPGGADGEREPVGGLGVALLLVAGECAVHRLAPGQGLADGAGEQVGGEERVGDAHAGAGVFVVAGVAGQRPARPG
jgi:hypothetical protein